MNPTDQTDSSPRPLDFSTLDFSTFDERAISARNIERHLSYEVEKLSEMSAAPSSPRHSSRNLQTSTIEEHQEPGGRSGANTPRASCSDSETHSIVAEGWEALKRSLVYFRGQPVGTIAALDHTEAALNYNQVLFSFLTLVNYFNIFC